MAQLLTFPLPRHWLLQLAGFSVVIERRLLWCLLGSLCLLSLVILATLLHGSEVISLAQLQSLFSSTPDALAQLIIVELRLPRIFAAAVAGYALGLSGILLQTVFANRLASPDVLGINEAATLAIVAYVMVYGTSAWPTQLAPLGASLASLCLYFLARRDGSQGSLFLITGICLAEFLRAIVEFFLSLGALHEIQNIYTWLQGSFIGQSFATVLPIAVLLLLSLPLQWFISPRLGLLRLPAPIVLSLGAPLFHLRLVCMVLGVLCAAAGTAIGGPIVFIAMAAPIMVSMLLGPKSSPSLACSGVMGSLVLVGCDALAQSLLPAVDIPVGIVSRIFGGMFLLWCLMRDRQSRGNKNG